MYGVSKTATTRMLYHMTHCERNTTGLELPRRVCCCTPRASCCHENSSPASGDTLPNTCTLRHTDHALMQCVCNTSHTSAGHAQLRAHGPPDRPTRRRQKHWTTARGRQRRHHVIKSWLGPEEKHEKTCCITTGGVSQPTPSRYDAGDFLHLVELLTSTAVLSWKRTRRRH